MYLFWDTTQVFSEGKSSYLSNIGIQVRRINFSHYGGKLMKPVLSAVSCLVLCVMPAWAKAKPAAAMTDQQFIDLAAQIDMVEANLGQMAGSVGGSDEVK